MSSEPPLSPSRPARPDTDFRRRALVAHGHTPSPEVRVGQRQSLQDELARIPDLDDGARPDAAVALAAPSPSVISVPTVPTVPAVSTDAEPASATVTTEAESPVEAGASDGASVAPAPVAASDEIDPWGVEVRVTDGDIDDESADDFDEDTADQRVIALAVAAADGQPRDLADEISFERYDEDPLDEARVAPGGPLVKAVAAARIESAERHMVRPEPIVVVDPAGRTPWWRRIGFAAAVLVLVAAIPALGLEGYRLVTNSTDGRFGTAVRSPQDPGYQEPVTPTPTALVMQTNAEGAPVALAVIALSSSSGGGSVILVPLDTAVRTPAYGIDRIGRAYDVLKERPADGRKQVAFQVASTLNIGLDEVIELDDRRWAQLVAPFGGLEIENPDPVVLGDGVELPSGPLKLTPEQVGPFMAARSGAEGDLNRMNRQSLVWSAWLKAIDEADGREVLPGEQDSGIALFANSLAKGDVAIDPLPGEPSASGAYVVDEGQMIEMVVDAVPAPVAAYPGSRSAVRVLNGWAPAHVPDELLRRIVHVRGSINSIGNGPAFGQKRSSIVYSDPADKGPAELLAVALGGVPTVRLDRSADDQIDLTLLVGKDLLDYLGEQGGGG